LICVNIIAEVFNAKGLKIIDKGWLNVYPYDKWVDHELPEFTEHSTIVPSSLMVEAGQTCPPRELSEADLISKMDANGIGTDATIHEHIKTVFDRGYAQKQGMSIVPTSLGMALVECYEDIAVPLNKPYLRAQMEKEMKMIAEGNRKKNEVLKECLQEMEKVFSQVTSKQEKMKGFLKQALAGFEDWKANNFSKEETKKEQVKKGGENDNNKRFMVGGVLPCQMCNEGRLRLIKSKAGGVFLGCTKYPECKNTGNFPKDIKAAEVTANKCKECSKELGGDVFRISTETITGEKDTHCIGGCDNAFQIFIIKRSNPAKRKSPSKEPEVKPEIKSSPRKRKAGTKGAGKSKKKARIEE
jgi:DNA topoisomerase-3